MIRISHLNVINLNSALNDFFTTSKSIKRRRLKFNQCNRERIDLFGQQTAMGIDFRCGVSLVSFSVLVVVLSNSIEIRFVFNTFWHLHIAPQGRKKTENLIGSNESDSITYELDGKHCATLVIDISIPIKWISGQIQKLVNNTNSWFVIGDALAANRSLFTCGLIRWIAQTMQLSCESRN